MLERWQKLFPDADHRHPMGLQPGNAASFWQTRDATGRLMAERQKWLAMAPADHIAWLPGKEVQQAAAEARRWMAQWAAEPEPDWVLLSSDIATGHRVLGGEVVFPSSWSLPEKLGLPLHLVHVPVPGLEQALGAHIQTFLSRLQPGAAWERENWGLAADAELNHHPSRHRPRLGPEASLASTWLRLERQFITRLTSTPHLLFGIRVESHRLDLVAALPGMAARLSRALRSMDAAVAAYKGLALPLSVLIAELEAMAAGAEKPA